MSRPRVVAAVVALVVVLRRAADRHAAKARRLRRWGRSRNRAAWRIARARGDRRSLARELAS